MPRSVTALIKTAVSVATLLASCHADSSPSVAIFLEKVVMNAVDNAPSANRSRNRFGTRNAIRKASRFRPAPNNPANTCSRINPTKREHITAMATIPVVLVLTRCSLVSATAEEQTEGDGSGKGENAECSGAPPQQRSFCPRLLRYSFAGADKNR